MSGIFGVINVDQPQEVDKLLRTMRKELLHHEWYVEETFCDELDGVGLGRIGIGIFNREQQPVTGEDKKLQIFLSGELYHTAEIRHELKDMGIHFRNDSDLELILRLYQYKGVKFINDLQGVFLLAIWDSAKQHLIIANDRMGLMPLFYANYKGKLVFAPEMKAILCDSEFRKELDLTALAEYIRFQHLLGDKTFFNGLKLLPNASLLLYDARNDRLWVESYWDFACLPKLPSTLTFNDAVEEAGRLLKESVEHLTTGEHRLGVFLSGGMDSRVILGMIPHDRFPVTTITFGRKNSRDVVFARSLAAKVGTDHHYLELKDGTWVKDYVDYHLRLTEGSHSWIHSHGISVLGQVRPLIDVNLSGFGGGELNWESLATLNAEDDLAFQHHIYYLLLNETTWPGLDDIEENQLFSSKYSLEIRGLAFDSLRNELAKYDHLPYAQRAASFSRFNPDRRLFQNHTNFHRPYFEERFPFCDYQYFDFVYALPPEMLFSRKLRRAVILKMTPAVAKIPYDKDGLPITANKPSRLIAKTLQRARSYFNRNVFPMFREYSTLYADYEGWLRNELREWAENILFGEKTKQRNIFDSRFLSSLWHRHQSRFEVNTLGKIAPIMTYEMMLRQYFD